MNANKMLIERKGALLRVNSAIFSSKAKKMIAVIMIVVTVMPIRLRMNDSLFHLF